MSYRAVVEAGKLADRQVETLRKALMSKQKEKEQIKDIWDHKASRIIQLKKDCKSLKDSDNFAKYLAEELRRAYKDGANDLRYEICNILHIV